MTAPTSEKNPILDVKEIMKILPHRYPLLLLDKIIELDLEAETIVGQKNLTINEAFFQGHFPGAPIMPGVLILEALAQCGAVLVKLRADNDKICVLLNISRAKFRHPVRPGDVLKLHCEGVHFSSNGGKVKAKAMVDGKLAAQTEMGFAFLDQNKI